MLISVLPPLEDDLLIRLFHKAARHQWTSADFDWDEPVAFDERQRRAIARLLTPVYLGEQTAMLGAASVMPEVARARQTSAQVYLASFIMDEARHFEALTRLYAHLGHDPVSLREMPEMLRYHHRLRQGDKVDWVWGILISDIFAKHFYNIFAERFPEALFGRMSQKIIVDEGRHQAFAEEYLRRALPALDDDRRRALLRMRDELLQIMQNMYAHLRDDTEALAIDGRRFFEDLSADIDRHIRNVGLLDGARDGEGDGEGGSAPAGRRYWASALPRRREGAEAEGEPDRCTGGLLASCADCFLALLCRSRLVRQAVLATAR